MEGFRLCSVVLARLWAVSDAQKDLPPPMVSADNSAVDGLPTARSLAAPNAPTLSLCKCELADSNFGLQLRYERAQLLQLPDDALHIPQLQQHLPCLQHRGGGLGGRRHFDDGRSQ